MDESTSKLTAGLQQTLRAAEGEEQLPIIVRYAPTRQMLRHREAMPGVRESYHYRLRPFAHMHATPEAIQRLQADPEIVRVYQDLPVHAFLDTSVSYIGAPRLWDENLKGSGVRIAIVDTGLDVTHPDFVNRIGEVADLTGEGLEDPHGHGTHCASAAAGSGAASGGAYRGVAPEATIYSAKVLRSDGQGMMSDVMAGVEWAVDRDVQVISLSLGGPGPCDGSDALSETCDAAMEQGVVVVVAGGNEGPAPYTIGSPGCARQVITVGACDERGHVAVFSSRGPTGDGRAKPDVVVPGVDIVAARAANTGMGDPIDKYYTSASGTSMATPQVAGVCALLLEAEPELTPAEIKQRLMETAISLGENAYAQGDGRVDAWFARHNEEQPEEPDPTPPDPTPVTPSGCLMAAVNLWLKLRPGKDKQVAALQQTEAPDCCDPVIGTADGTAEPPVADAPPEADATPENADLAEADTPPEASDPPTTDDLPQSPTDTSSSEDAENGEVAENPESVREEDTGSSEAPMPEA